MKIQYHEIIALGFKEEFCTDNVYFNQFGFQYAIITKKLQKGIYLEWAKEVIPTAYFMTAFGRK